MNRKGEWLMRLQDKVTVVTASTRGIGLAIARACAAEGAVVYMAARDTGRAQAEADRLRAAGCRVKVVYNDASKPETYAEMISQVVQNEGRIDVLINNYGGSDPSKDRDIFHTDPSVYLATVSINLRSVFLGCQAAVRHMARQGGGSIVNISSVGGQVPDVSQIGYGTAKAAINFLTQQIAVQAAGSNIRCNAILPGMTATDAVEQKLTGDFRALFLRHIPLHRMGKPEEIAAAAVYFASDESAYATGQILTLSGGFGLATPIYGDVHSGAAKR